MDQHFGSTAEKLDTCKSVASEAEVLKNEFYDWLSKRPTSAEPQIFVSCMDGVSEFLKRNSVLSEDLWEFGDYAEFDFIYKNVLNDKKFKTITIKIYDRFVETGNLFLEFLSDFAGKNGLESPGETNRGGCIEACQLATANSASENVSVESAEEQGRYLRGGGLEDSIAGIETQCASKDYGKLLEEAKWFETLFTQEIPSRNVAIKNLVENLTRIPSLEIELDRLRKAYAAKEEALARLEAEKSLQETAYERLKTKFDIVARAREQERNRFEEETQRLVENRDQLSQEVAALEAEILRRDKGIDEVRGVRKMLQAILRSLQGKGDTSSISDSVD